MGGSECDMSAAEMPGSERDASQQFGACRRVGRRGAAVGQLRALSVVARLTSGLDPEQWCSSPSAGLGVPWVKVVLLLLWQQDRVRIVVVLLQNGAPAARTPLNRSAAVLVLAPQNVSGVQLKTKETNAFKLSPFSCGSPVGPAEDLESERVRVVALSCTVVLPVLSEGDSVRRLRKARNLCHAEGPNPVPSRGPQPSVDSKLPGPVPPHLCRLTASCRCLLRRGAERHLGGHAQVVGRAVVKEGERRQGQSRGKERRPAAVEELGSVREAVDEAAISLEDSPVPSRSDWCRQEGLGRPVCGQRGSDTSNAKCARSELDNRGPERRANPGRFCALPWSTDVWVRPARLRQIIGASDAPKWPVESLLWLDRTRPDCSKSSGQVTPPSDRRSCCCGRIAPGPTSAGRPSKRRPNIRRSCCSG